MIKQCRANLERIPRKGQVSLPVRELLHSSHCIAGLTPGAYCLLLMWSYMMLAQQRRNTHLIVIIACQKSGIA